MLRIRRYWRIPMWKLNADAVGIRRYLGKYPCGYVGAEYRATPQWVFAYHAFVGDTGWWHSHTIRTAL